MVIYMKQPQGFLAVIPDKKPSIEDFGSDLLISGTVYEVRGITPEPELRQCNAQLKNQKLWLPYSSIYMICDEQTDTTS